LRGKVSDRKLRLFAVACCRGVWNFFTDADLREAVVTAERFADGEVSERHRLTAAAVINPKAAYFVDATGFVAIAASSCLRSDAFEGARHAAQVIINDIHETFGNADARQELAQTLRCLVGPLAFRQREEVPASWPNWSGGFVRNFAAAIYETREFDRLPLLADALEDAGCIDADMLGHCRTRGPHARGCWVVDLLTGKK
jgi:hypothetical protein